MLELDLVEAVRERDDPRRRDAVARQRDLLVVDGQRVVDVAVLCRGGGVRGERR